MLALSKRFQEARPEFETAIRLAPTLFEPHYLYARACWAEGLMAEAAQHFEDASRVRPEDYQAPALLATSLEALGERVKADAAHRRALEVIRRHLELYPTDVRALYMGAIALRQIGEDRDAQDWAQHALGAGSDDPAVYYNLACFYALGEDAAQALDCLERAFALGFAHPEWLQHDPDLRSLQQHPRLRALLDRISGG